MQTRRTVSNKNATELTLTLAAVCWTATEISAIAISFFHMHFVMKSTQICRNIELRQRNRRRYLQLVAVAIDSEGILYSIS